MRPTRMRDLAVAAALLLLGVWLLLHPLYVRLPALPRSATLTLLVVGLAEAQTALVTRARLAGRPGTKPVLPLTVARLAALAKASSVAGAGFGGAWAGVLAYTLPRAADLGAARRDAVTAALGVGAAAVLLAAALLLERCCRSADPPRRATGRSGRSGAGR